MNGILQFSGEIEEIFLKHFSKISFIKLIFTENCRYLFVNFVETFLWKEYKQKINNFSKDETQLPKRLQPTRIFYNINLEKFMTTNG